MVPVAVDNSGMPSQPAPKPRGPRRGVLQKSLEQLQRNWRAELHRSIPGMLLSLIVHTCIFLVMGLIVYQVQTDSMPPMTDMLWGEDIGDGTDFELGNFEMTSGVEVNIDDNLPSLPSSEQMLDLTMPSLDLTAPLKTTTAIPQKATFGNVFSGRSSGQQGERIRQSGGNPNATRTIRMSLEWIARQQQKDGRWQFHEGYPQASPGSRCDAAATGLALLTFLGAGSTPKDGDYRREVYQGIKWLLEHQKRNGNLDQGDGPSISVIYSHAIATIALCECYAMTGDPEMKSACENAIRYLDEAQLRGEGGWRYGILSPGSGGDLSVTGWALMALQTARVAGIEVEPRIFRKSTGFLNRLESSDPWLYSYTPGRSPTLSMTAEGLVCRQWMGMEPNSKIMRNGISYLTRPQNLPQWKEGRRNVYAWYYLAHALHNNGGETWKEWYGYTQKILMEQQLLVPSEETPGDIVGSWHPHTPQGDGHDYGDRWGRLYVTCLCTLILETPFRHLPLYEVADLENTTKKR